MPTVPENPDDFTGKSLLICFCQPQLFHAHCSFHKQLTPPTTTQQRTTSLCSFDMFRFRKKEFFCWKLIFVLFSMLSCRVTEAHSTQSSWRCRRNCCKTWRKKILRRLSIFISFSHLSLNAPMRPSTSVKNNHVLKRWRNWNSARVSNRLMISEWKPANVETKWKI